MSRLSLTNCFSADAAAVGAAFWERNTGIDWECRNHLGTLWPEDPSLSVTGRLWRQIGWYTAVKWQRICVVAISWWTPSEKYAQVKVQPFSADADDTRANASQCPDRSCLGLFLAFYPQYYIPWSCQKALAHWFPACTVAIPDHDRQ